jgi:phage baseplate assembly protein W
MAKQSIYRDFDLSFKKHPLSGDIATVYDDAAIKLAIKNLLRLSPYSKPFSPQIASPLYGFLFEPVDFVIATAIETRIKILLEDFEPRIRNIRVTVDPNPDENRYDVSLEFVVRKTNRADGLDLFLPVERLR